MDETPSDRPPRTHIAQISSADDPTEGEKTDLNRLVVWLGAFLILGLVVAVSLAIYAPSQGKEEKAAIGAAVKRYAEIFHESPKTIYKYRQFRVARDERGDWRVKITRVIVPGAEGGYGITSIFKVDRSGACEYVGQVEETGR